MISIHLCDRLREYHHTIHLDDVYGHSNAIANDNKTKAAHQRVGNAQWGHKKMATPFKKCDMVILQEDGLVPGKVSLARTVQVYPGKDKVVHIVSIRTMSY